MTAPAGPARGRGSAVTGLARRAPDTPAAVALVALALVTLFVVVHLAANGWRFGAFTVAGDFFVDRSTAPADIAAAVNPDSYGYDGQFVYRFAYDPVTDEVTEHGIMLDNAPYRHQRIGLPVVAWLVTAATPLSTAAALVVVNALALVGACWLSARFAQRYGRPAAWGLVAGLSPGLLISLARDLTEPLAWFLMLAALLAWLDRRLVVATALFTAAALTRETTLVVAGGLGAWHLWTLLRRTAPDRRDAVLRCALLLVPLAVQLGWQLWLRAVWGETPTVAAGPRGAPPLFGVLGSMLHHNGSWLGTDRQSLLNHLWFVERWLLAAFYVVVAASLRRTAVPPEIRVAWVFAAVLGLTPGGWMRDVQFLRAASEAISVGLLVMIATPAASGRRVLQVAAGTSVAVGATYAVFL